jgi:hypothetical protein
VFLISHFRKHDNPLDFNDCIQVLKMTSDNPDGTEVTDVYKSQVFINRSLVENK